jgi:O-antigen/teichoic acid export membrane protein
MNGLKHHDVHRFEREMRFGPIVLVEVIPQVMITIMAWTVARMTGNYAAVLWLLIARSCVMLIISHAVAERPYRVAWDPRYVREMLTFGWPLLVNGVLLFGVFQGDRLIAGAGYSMEDLAVYSVAATLAVTPTFMLLKIVGAMMLPLLSRSRDHQPSFQNHYILCTRTLSLIAAIFGLWFIVAGQSFVVLVYGEKYAAAVPILGWLVAGHALRVMRAAPTVAAMALGDTRNLMISNVVRCLGLFLAVACAWGGMGLSTVAACGLVGETLAFFAAGLRLSVHHRVSFGTSLRPAAFAVLIIGVSVILSTEQFMEGHWGRQIWAAIGLTITALVAAGLMSPELRKLYTGVVNFGPKMFVHSRPIDAAALMKGKPD